MATKFKLPDLGEGIDSAEVVRVLVSDGDTVEEGQSVLEVEAEKASLEVPSDAAGRVSQVHVNEGDTVKIGQTIFSLEPVKEAGGEAPEARAAEREKPVAEVAPEKEQAAAKEAAGEEVRKAWERPEEEEPKREKVRADARKAPAEEKPAEAEAEREEAEAAERGAVAAAPSIRQFAREIGVDIAEVSGSGPGGRISMDDVKEHARRRRLPRPEEEEAKEPAPPPRPIAPSPAPAEPERLSLPDFEKFGSIYREPITSIRRTISRQLSLSWSTIPHVTLFEEADVTALEALREQYQDRAEEAGGKLTITPIILKIVAVALKVFPRLNASVDLEGGEIIYKQYYHLGVAIDTERGLLVPVIRDVDKKGIIQLSAELAQIAERARHGMLTREEMQGGSFTVTSLGGIGTTFFTPIINFPEVAILGLGRVRPQPGPDPQSPPRLMLPLSLSIDHRLVDGADGARFLQWIVDAVNQPLMLAMEG